jgi:EAL domain-containing protein (putative c-di-GMP-specific phosphodiesterase class I)
VTREALMQCRFWHDQGFAVGVAVNICSRDLLDSGLPDEVAATLAEAGLPPGILELEITEDTILTDPVRAKIVLARLSDMGVRLAIDDFGSGHSSLGYLKRLPVTTLKIDRSFVANMDDDENDAVIVRSTIELGHNLGLKVIAEGVENADVLRRLAALACDEIQGYHLSRPLPAETATTLLRTNRAESGRGQRPAAA